VQNLSKGGAKNLEGGASFLRGVQLSSFLNCEAVSGDLPGCFLFVQWGGLNRYAHFNHQVMQALVVLGFGNCSVF
ncbi:MAG: hypothetical protein IIT70_00655, partial [Clostridia bacterium]|nr:hypothetical protein [Clostridia bacterium]